MARILIVDDVAVMRRGYKALLEGEGFEVETARDGNEALAKFAANRPDLVLLDVMMPGRNGFTTCAEMRKIATNVPILFLTAMHDDADIVRGLSLGADDYIAKSSSKSVILARVQRALAREGETARRMRQTDKMVIGDYVLDFNLLTLSKGDTIIERLTRTEATLIKLLTSTPGRVFTNDEIVTALRGEGFVCEDSLIYSHTSRLRRKLEPAGIRIENISRAGYRLTLP